MNHPLAAKVITRKRRATTKIRSFLALALSFCLLGMSYSTFAQQPITTQIDSTNQSVFKPNVSLEAGQASENPTRKFDPPYPFTVHQLKEMLLEVAALKDAPKDGVEVLEIFNLPVHEFIKKRPKGMPFEKKGFSLSSSNDWYFLMAYSLNERTKIGRFVFAWLDDPFAKRITLYPPPPAGLCINSKKFIDKLESAGWRLKTKIKAMEGNHAPPHNTYVKDDFSALRIYFSRWDSCLFEIEVWWADSNFISEF